MIRKKQILLILFVAIVIVSFFPGYSDANQWIKPTQKESLDTVGGSILKKMEYFFSGGDVYWMHQITAEHNERPYVLTVPIKGQHATFRYREYMEGPMKQPYWNIVRLEEINTLPLASGFIEAEGKYIWLGMPTVYADLGRGTVEEKRDMVLPIELRSTSGGFVLEIRLPKRAGYISEIWALESREPLIRWDDKTLESIWLGLDVTQNAKWLYDGYYYKSPSTYEPYAENAYWRIPENYLLRSYLYTGESKAANDMGYVMLKTSLRQQEQQGYWKSLPRSLWLSEDYGIPEGFYDTRFNTGAAEMMLRGCIQYQEGEFCEAAKSYAAFFQNHAVTNHYVIDGVRPGWLIPDYSSPGQHARTHVSLNHQLAEINYLYSMYMQFGNPTDKDLADTMLNGVVNLGSKWLLKNGDLHYAYFPNGTFGRADYPYLTYNDLLETQRLYKALHGMEEATLTRLIESKLAWMKQNNVAYVGLLEK